MVFNIQVGKPVSGENLIGRDKDIKLIRQLLIQGQSIVLVAPRRFGKTSILLEVIDQLRNEGYYTAFIDMFTITSLEGLAEQITEKILNNKTICGLDEFGDISKLNGQEIIKLFRSKIQLHHNSSFLFAGSYASVMSRLFISKDAPFYRFARVINISFIDTISFLEYYKMILKKVKISISEKFLFSILNFTKGHPYYSQLALQQLITLNALDRKELFGDINEYIEYLFTIEKDYIEKLWEELSKSRDLMQVLLALVKQEKSLYSYLDSRKINIPRTLKKLVGNGTLFQTGKNYILSDPLLEYFIRKYLL